MVSGMFWTLFLLRDFPCKCLGELLTVRATCLDLSVGQILNTTNVYFLNLSFRFGLFLRMFFNLIFCIWTNFYFSSNFSLFDLMMRTSKHTCSWSITRVWARRRRCTTAMRRAATMYVVLVLSHTIAEIGFLVTHFMMVWVAFDVHQKAVAI